MQKQTSLILALFTMVLSIVPVHVSKADNNADITRALQAEYQSQLKRTHQVRRSSRRSQVEREILADYQRLLNQSRARKRKRNIAPRKQNIAPRRAPRVVAKPVPVVEKPPIPDAEDLFDAATRGDINTISRLLDEGININVANQQKETALHMAAARGRYSTVIFLIKNGANPFARTVKQWLAIHHATRFRHANIARYLMQKGLSPRFKTSDGYSSIDMARTNNDRALLSVFGAR